MLLIEASSALPVTKLVSNGPDAADACSVPVDGSVVDAATGAAGAALPASAAGAAAALG